MQSNEERLQAIFRGVLNLPAGVEVSACAQENTAAWDSMAHVTLIAAIEGEFGIAIDAGDSLTLTSYDSARQYLAEVGA
jgi:acyl carrier protein